MAGRASGRRTEEFVNHTSYGQLHCLHASSGRLHVKLHWRLWLHRQIRYGMATNLTFLPQDIISLAQKHDRL